MDELKCAPVILQATLQIFCISVAIAAYNDRHNNGGRVFWWWFAAGFSFQFARRVMYMLVLLGVPDLKFFTFIVMPTAVSVCYTVAMVKVVQYARDRSKDVAESRRKIVELTERLGHGCRIQPKQLGS